MTTVYDDQTFIIDNITVTRVGTYCSDDAGSTGNRPINITANRQHQLIHTATGVVTINRGSTSVALGVQPQYRYVGETGWRNYTPTTGNITWNIPAASNITVQAGTGHNRTRTLTAATNAAVGNHNLTATWASPSGNVTTPNRVVTVTESREYRLVWQPGRDGAFTINRGNNTWESMAQVQWRYVGSTTWVNRRDDRTAPLTWAILGPVGGLSIVEVNTGYRRTPNIVASPNATLGSGGRSLQVSFTAPPGAANAGTVLTATRSIYVTAYREYQIRMSSVGFSANPLNINRGTTSVAENSTVRTEGRYIGHYGGWAEVATGSITWSAPVAANLTLPGPGMARNAAITANNNSPLGNHTVTASWQSPAGIRTITRVVNVTLPSAPSVPNAPDTSTIPDDGILTKMIYFTADNKYQLIGQRLGR